MSLDTASGFDTASIPYAVIDRPSLPRVVDGHMYHVCSICSVAFNARAPFCFVRVVDEAKASHRHCDACRDLLASDPDAYHELVRQREQRKGDETARALFSAHWPVLPTLPAPAAPAAPELEPDPHYADIAITPTELSRLPGDKRGHALRAYVAYSAHGAQADAVYVSPWRIRQETGMSAIILRRTMLRLESLGYAAQVTRQGKAHWRLFFGPETRRGAK